MTSIAGWLQSVRSKQETSKLIFIADSSLHFALGI
jgi:hypothetical protein